MSEQNELPQPPAISPQMTLSQIVDVLVASDDGRLQLTEEEHRVLALLIRSKVDGCVQFRAEVEDHIARQKAWAEDHASYARTLERGLGRFDQYVTHVMQSGAFEKLPGEKFQITIKKTTYCDMPNRAPTEQDFEVMGPEFVRRSEKVERSWNKVEITRALKAGTFPFENIGQLKERLSPVYDIKKGKI